MTETSTLTATDASDDRRAGRHSPPRPGTLLQGYALVLCWLLMIAGFSLALGESFLSWQTLGTMFSSQTVLLLLALATLLPLTAGDFDLSVAATLTVSGMTLAVLDVQHGWPIAAAAAVALLVAVGTGLVNGLLVVGFDLDSFIVTLATSTVLSGLVLLISDTSTVTGVEPQMSRWIIGERLFGVSLQFYYGLAVVLVLWWVLTRTPAGVRLLFVGRNRSVSRLSGVRVGRVRVTAFAASAALAGLAGIVLAGGQGGIDPTSGTSFLLPAYAAAFLGATAIRPGRFNPVGTLIAVYFLVTGITGLQLLGADAYVQQLFYGGALLLAVIGSRIASRRETRAA
jgi:ribose transport system permease protein